MSDCQQVVRINSYPINFKKIAICKICSFYAKSYLQLFVCINYCTWKKKDPKELALQSTVALYGESKTRQIKKSEREQKKVDQQKELLADIHSLNKRLLKKDAVKEHEQKMKDASTITISCCILCKCRMNKT